ncbi:MAG TPA: N-6 DNA methylase [Blastocatellia bacterium]|nr:N-6 DNA methylase [Blastocatellia bacterium]
MAARSFDGAFEQVNQLVASFQKKLDECREQLARAFKDKNPRLDSRELTEVTRRALDRLVFMRFLEDKLIEPPALIENLGARGTAWQDFVAASHRLDQVYNGTVFKNHALMDGPDFRVDERVFGVICEGLARKNSPYDFNAVPIHILGSIYERFLGKPIIATDDRARVEGGPEARKSGGVYYTPEYIVRYIVENTVGNLIAGKTPEEVREMRFADIACGGGSFLLGVYDLLLGHHTAHYNKNETNRAKGVKAGCEGRGDGTLRLSLRQRRDILLSNIYGADIDAQAVEVARLSLYLKLLEEETTATARGCRLEMREALLPSLSENIVCGNSLIDHDILNGKLNPMSFEVKFPDVMKRGGFDAIVGNPPYIRIQSVRETAPTAADYYRKKYAAARKGNYDIYVIFVERALKLLNGRGRLGYILPHKFFNAQYGAPLRKMLAEGKHLSHIVHFGDQQVFVGATTYTCCLILNRSSSERLRFVKVLDLNAWRETGKSKEGQIPATLITDGEWNFVVGEGASLFEKLGRMPLKLKDAAAIFVGLQTSADDVFIMDYVSESARTLRLRSRILNSECVFEKNFLFPLISGTDAQRYGILPERQYILFPYEIKNGIVELIDFDTLSNEFPSTASYLRENRKRLEAREGGRMNGPQWYGYIYLKNMKKQAIEKICVPRLVEQLCAAYDAQGDHFLDNVDVGGVVWKADYQEQGLRYLLGLLNSKLLRWYFPFVSAPFRGGWLSANRQFLSQLPIRTINFSDAADKARHARLVELVEQMLAAKRQSAATRTDRDKTYYENKCAAIDRRIDRLVYELYDLTDEEISIVEAT